MHLLLISMETTTDTKSTITLVDGANSQLQNTIFQHSETLSLHAMLIKICLAVWNIAHLSHHCGHCWNVPPTASLCSHSLFGLNKYSLWINGCHFFFPHGEFNSTPLFHPRFHVRYHSVRLPLCCYHVATKFNTILVGNSTSTANHQHLPLMLWANIIKEKTLQSSPYILNPISKEKHTVSSYDFGWEFFTYEEHWNLTSWHFSLRPDALQMASRKVLHGVWI